jgi:sterol desaturase/sphingolipid hydroxylase (fatty acid hydroxylase superfamily)
MFTAELSPIMILSIVPFVYYQLLFWTTSIVLLFFADNQSNWAKKFKLQKEYVTWVDVKKCTRVVLQNQFFITLPCCIVQAYMLRATSPLLASFSNDPSSIDTPDWKRILFQFYVCSWIQEVLFYYSHRLLVSV